MTGKICLTLLRPQVGKLPAPSLLSAGTTIMRPAGPGGVARPALPTRPLQVSAASSSLMPPPKVKVTNIFELPTKYFSLAGSRIGNKEVRRCSLRRG